MTNKMPCRVTDEHRPNPHENCMTKAEEQHAEDSINKRIDEMIIDTDYLPDALIETGPLFHVITTIHRVSEQETTDGEIMARDVGMEKLIDALRDALRPLAIKELADESSPDRELERADRERDR